MKYIAIPFFLILFSSCASQYKLEKQRPTTIGDIYYQQTVGGREGACTQYEVMVPISGEGEILQDMYFRNRKAPLKEAENNLYTASFCILEKSPDIIMSDNVVKEYGNAAPLDTEDFPFMLEDDEAVISFKDGKKTRFFKIEKIKEKGTVYLPSQRPQNNP